MGADQLWNELAALGSRRSFRVGDHLLRWDDSETTGLIAITRGVCKVVNSTADGRETLVAVRGGGEIVGELAALTGQVRSASVVALSPVRASVVSAPAFDRWLDEHPGAGRLLATMLAARIVETTRPSTGAHHRVEVRLADRLLFLADRFQDVDDGHESRIEVPLTHDDYAAWVGATRAVATRAMGSLRDRGLIDFGRGWFQMTDRRAMEQLVLHG